MFEYYTGDRATYQGMPCTITETNNEWVDDEYITLSVNIKCDSGKKIKNVKLSELTDDLRFLDRCSSWNHGYSHCKVYGLTREQLIKILAESDEEYAQVYLNGQEEADGSITFDAYRIIPDDIVNIFSEEDCFVFAGWHWDGDIFCCSEADKLQVKIKNCEETEEDEYMADIYITANDKYNFFVGASDFSEDEISFYKKLRR